MAKASKSASDKKALRKEVAYQLENALGKLKDRLGEKKFNSRVHKAVKLLTEGIKKGDKKAKEETVSAIPAKKKAAVKKAGINSVDKKSPAKKKAATKKPVAVKQNESAKDSTSRI